MLWLDIESQHFVIANMVTNNGFSEEIVFSHVFFVFVFFALSCLCAASPTADVPLNRMNGSSIHIWKLFSFHSVWPNTSLVWGKRPKPLCTDISFFNIEAQSQYNPSLMAYSPLMALMFNQSKSWVLPRFCWHPLIWPPFICLLFFSFYCHNSQLPFIAGLTESCATCTQQLGWRQMTHSQLVNVSQGLLS